jgi:enoyl-CoA hydratase
MIAMPEVSIGFSPDVGTTWLLTRNDGEIGTHVALTTTRLGAADAIAANFADMFVSEDAIADLVAALGADDVDLDVDATITRFAVEPPIGNLVGSRDWIDECYAADSVPEILDRLRAKGSDGAATAADQIEANSPTAVTVALEALRRARALPSLEACLDMEFRIAVTFFEGTEFREGIRAAVIDKDRSPKWDPASLAEVTHEAVAEFFAPQPDDIHLARGSSA